MNDLLHFLRTRWMELLIAGVWLQSLVGAALARDWAVLSSTGLGGLVLLTAVFWLVERLRRKRMTPVGTGEAFLVPRRGLILTIGGQKETAVFAIQTQKPEWVGLLCSRQSESVASEIITICQLPTERVQKEIVDPWDILDVRDKMEALLKWLARKGVAYTEMAIDITGATTPMSVGAFMVAEESRLDTQYVRSQYDAGNKVIPKTQEGILVSRHSTNA